MTATAWSVRRVHALGDAQIEELATVLIDCVDGGASVSFMHPLSRDRAVAFWQRVARGVAAGERAVLVAEDARGLCGTVQLVLDAVTGGDAARLYERLGWVRVRDIPGFALYPQGGLCGTTFYYRNLDG